MQWELGWADECVRPYAGVPALVCVFHIGGV
jgi:hypothetical protein